jgi:hypothetical protein
MIMPAIDNPFIADQSFFTTDDYPLRRILSASGLTPGPVLRIQPFSPD